jgi:peptidoglycan/LPS O-acetylase OafA/YrhL
LKGNRLFGIAAILAAILFLYLTATVSFTDEWLYRGGFTFVAGLAALVILTAANSPPLLLSAALQWFPLRWFGRISYGLYLWHWMVIKTTTLYYFGYWEPWAKLALAVGTAAASFYVVELPFIRLKTRFASRASRAQSSPLPATADEVIPALTMSTAN